MDTKVYDILDTILDPELHVSLVKLGLIYDVKIDDTVATVTMTLTTVGCPLFETMEEEIKQKVLDGLPELTAVNVELTFDPPWSVEKIHEETQIELGLA